jgi:hypothetical protein
MQVNNTLIANTTAASQLRLDFNVEVHPRQATTKHPRRFTLKRFFSLSFTNKTERELSLAIEYLQERQVRVYCQSVETEGTVKAYYKQCLELECSTRTVVIPAKHIKRIDLL